MLSQQDGLDEVPTLSKLGMIFSVVLDVNLGLILMWI